MTSQNWNRCWRVVSLIAVTLAAVADQDAGDDHRDRSGRVQVQRQCVEAGHQGQRNHDFDGVLVDRLHGVHRDVSGHDAKDGAAARLDQEHLPGMDEADIAAVDRDADKHREDNNADPVVEQAFAGDADLQRLGSRIVFSNASTATGSVGEISAPNVNAQTSGSSMPRTRAANHKPAPTITVEISTPTVAIRPTAHASVLSLPKSICSAPANSRYASIPFIIVSKKSICATAPVKACSKPVSGATSLTTTRVSDVASPRTSRPIVCGR